MKKGFNKFVLKVATLSLLFCSSVASADGLTNQLATSLGLFSFGRASIAIGLPSDVIARSFDKGHAWFADGTRNPYTLGELAAAGNLASDPEIYGSNGSVSAVDLSINVEQIFTANAATNKLGTINIGKNGDFVALGDGQTGQTFNLSLAIGSIFAVKTPNGFSTSNIQHGLNYAGIIFAEVVRTGLFQFLNNDGSSFSALLTAGNLLAFVEDSQFGRDGDYNDHIFQISLANPVPEPATMTLLSLGGIGAMWRRKRQLAQKS